MKKNFQIDEQSESEFGSDHAKKSQLVKVTNKYRSVYLCQSLSKEVSAKAWPIKAEVKNQVLEIF